MTQNIRLSQFVTTYGPGALLEGQNGPRVILSPEIGLFFSSASRLDPANYEILEKRISNGLLKNGRIFRLPSNAETGNNDGYGLYRTSAFPTWKLCLRSSVHGGNFYVLHHGSKCPRCGNQSRQGTEAIRFIVACGDGHMDEFNWAYFVHRKKPCTEANWFKWLGGGGALSNVTVECNECGTKSESLGHAWGQDWYCSGRFPEREGISSAPLRLSCPKTAKLIQRQASNLRVPELRTLFSIPPRYTELHNLLQIPAIYDNLVGSPPASIADLRRILTNLANAKRISNKVADEVVNHPWDEIQNAMTSLSSADPSTYRELILEELEALAEASIKGVPPIKGPTPTSPFIFHVDPNLREFVSRGSHRFRVTPVLTLRTITVQTGYRREVGSNDRAIVVPVCFNDRVSMEQEWYPGVAFQGEGIFVSFEDPNQDFTPSGEASAKWSRIHESSNRYPKEVFRDESERDELHPTFVWWHTLAHLLIRTISAESGYSVASIRERVYVKLNGRTTKSGILLYATQPGSEGTLGGLIALVPHFQEMFDLSVEQMRTCSGDPLCVAHSFEEGQYNGAACYGCLLLSETSCEHRNLWLDRRVLLESSL